MPIRSAAFAFAVTLVLTLALTVLAAACGGDDEAPGPDGAPPAPDAAASPAPSTYTFSSRFVPGQSAVAYKGQSLRHVLTWEITNYLGGLTAQVDTAPPADDDVLAALLFYFDFDSSIGGTTPLALPTDPPLAQATFADVSTGADLRAKLAGNDAVTDHKVWNTPGQFLGWAEGGAAADTPTELVLYWLGAIDDLAFQRGLGNVGLEPSGAPIGKVFLTSKGQDLQQLTQKFLLGAITLSQGLDDYLDDATPGKGLLTSNLQDADKPYAGLEHAWDEGFGYFGAARDFGDYTDDEVAGKGGRPDYQGYHDSDGSGAIDVGAEYIFGHAQSCAKRDRESSPTAPTDFTKTAFDAFLAGRHLIATTDGELDAAALAELTLHRDAIAASWERCVAASVVHYINEVVADIATFGTADYEFADHAKHWSELKGFALSLQFAPRSPLHESTRFSDLHGYLGDAPILPGAAGGQPAVDQYRDGLLAARALLQEAYDFDPVNIEAW
jgi:hypothetical protein